ncbi:hypothetical protein SKAU_G00310990 [Synaphobranchus kaupii]|uniref:Uncharacterized protein n=1 Tax=Synaphobranchus kaupii TaxID=118154 RepID=A0A9Q1ERN0_SYNKA|nr:hypothetical protein SKAU_G00310990 [Synaphobranchus kaupii]
MMRHSFLQSSHNQELLTLRKCCCCDRRCCEEVRKSQMTHVHSIIEPAGRVTLQRGALVCLYSQVRARTAEGLCQDRPGHMPA